MQLDNNHKTIINNFMDSKRDGSAINQFSSYLGVESGWLSRLLIEIKEIWVNQGYSVTDILIRERMPVMLAVNKPHILFESEDESLKDKLQNLTSTNISEAVAKLNNSKREGVSSVENFSFSVEGLGIFRGNYSKDFSKSGLILRYLPFDIYPLDFMNYPKFYKDMIINLVEDVSIPTPFGIKKTKDVKRAGMILHVGPTGSGKSTGAASEIGFISENATGTILTYEEPIEQKHEVSLAPVRQFEIGRDILADNPEDLFVEIENHAARNNPSVIQFGELRNKKEIRAGMDMGRKGCMVIATIHARDVKEALTSLLATAKDEEYIVAQTITAIVAHRLITTRKGKIVPLYEIFIPTNQDREKLRKNELSSVMTSFHGKDNQHRQGITFTDTIAKLAKQGLLEADEAEELSLSLKGE